MADTKLSWTELRHALAVRAGVTEKEANTFLNAFNEQLIAALKSDKQVKVNGLGTFKLQAVAPRKSVNVTTGETIIIEGYNKVVFMPEAGVKELVENKGERLKVKGEKEEATIDPLKKLGEQAEEIVDILGELGQSPAKKKRKEKRGKRKEDATLQGAAESVQDGAKAPIEPEEKPVVEEPEVEEPQEEPKPVVEEKPEPVVEEPKPVVEVPKPKKKYHFMRDTLICVVILLSLLLVGYFFLRSQLSSWIEEMGNTRMENTERFADFDQNTDLISDEPAEEENIQPEEERAAPSEVSEQENEGLPVTGDGENVSYSTEERVYKELITTEPMHEASRLAWMAKRYYGDKIYWPYLYDANKDNIDNPSQIAVGTPIRVPKLSAIQKDTTSAVFQAVRKEAYEKVR